MSLLTAIALLLANTGVAQNPAPQPETLAAYLDSLHWDASKQGPLIAVAPDEVYLQEDAPRELSGFERKKVKIGGLQAIAPTWDVALDDADLPNAYQELSHQEKLYFLLATISQSDLQKLTGDGLSPSDLSGEQRQALLAMIPQPLSYSTQKHPDARTTESGGTFNVAAGDVPQVRLQLRKGVDIAFTTSPEGDNSILAHGLSSFDNEAKPGTTTALLSDMGSPYRGHLIDSAEKRSELSWSDPRLSKTVTLRVGETIGDVVDEVSKSTGIELYADPRVAWLTIRSYGNEVPAPDLLRALAVAVDGVYRRVGPAFVLTASLEGEAVLDMRLGTRSTIGYGQLEPSIHRWTDAIVKRGIANSMSPAVDDALGAAGIPSDAVVPDDPTSVEGWVPTSVLPAATRAAVYEDVRGSISETEPQVGPDLKGRVKITESFGIRFVIPGGMALDFEKVTLPSLPAPVSKEESYSEWSADRKVAATRDCVAIKCDDSSKIAGLCHELKTLGIPGIWIESSSSQAIQTAIDSGLAVSIVLEPWSVLKGETRAELDRNLLGQTGAQLQTFAEANPGVLDSRFGAVDDFIAPSSAELGQRWQRLLASIPKAGVSSIVVLSPAPSGYELSPGRDPFPGSDEEVRKGTPEVSFNSGRMVRTETLFDFGYVPELRLEFLRRFHMDPIDIAPYGPDAPAHPYFEYLWDFKVGYPVASNTVMVRLMSKWTRLKSSVLRARLRDLLDAVSPICRSVFVERPSSFFDGPPRLTEGLPPETLSEPDESAVQLLSMAPSRTKPDDGQPFEPPFTWDLEGPTCFDLRAVPPNRWTAYLKAILKVP